jgi:putative nucleotidyltransferase with HDIG domain
MTDDDRRLQANEDVVKRLLAAMRSSQLYSPEHPLVARGVDRLKEALDRSHAYEDTVVIGIVGKDLVVGNLPVMGTAGVSEAMQRLRAAGVERITIERGAPTEDIHTLVLTLGELQVRGDRAAPAEPARSLGRHIRLGRLLVQRRFETVELDCASVQQQYRESVAQTEVFLEEARDNGTPDPDKAQAIVGGLAQALSQNRTAVLALTAMKYYDNYTFTHLVNVAILTMAQARSLGVDGRLLRDFGLSGFMHDMGKILVPKEILTKTERLTAEEFAIIRHHPVDGAKILRRRREIPMLASAVAFEHHVRIDGTGYPAIERPVLNLATQLCSIADTYDAMRSKRSYQTAFPTDRILAVLEQNDGNQFDQHLVRRFCQLMGVYPPGTLVRLDSGEMAVVIRAHADAPRRPLIRVVLNADGERLAKPHDIALWAEDGKPWPAATISSLVDPADVEFNPLSFLDAPAA